MADFKRMLHYSDGRGNDQLINQEDIDYVQAVFDKADTNGDASLNTDELDAFKTEYNREAV